MSRITLTASEGAPLDGLLVYSDAEHSFRFEVGAPSDLETRSGGAGRTSLSVGTLQVEVDVATGVALFAWGLHPRERWSDGGGRPERQRPGEVQVHSTFPLEAGVAVPVAAVGVWHTIHDGMTGWVRVTSDERTEDDAQILIASGTVLGIRAGRLNSVWLNPVFESVGVERSASFVI